jgi:hypothetical protein
VNHGAPSGLTVLEAIEQLRSLGYEDDFSIVSDGVRCSRCGLVHAADNVRLIEVLRVEGASDPADEAIVAGLVCGSCRASGVLVAGYGPTEDPVEAAVLSRLEPGQATATVARPRFGPTTTGRRSLDG